MLGLDQRLEKEVQSEPCYIISKRVATAHLVCAYSVLFAGGTDYPVEVPEVFKSSGWSGVVLCF